MTVKIPEPGGPFGIPLDGDQPSGHVGPWDSGQSVLHEEGPIKSHMR